MVSERKEEEKQPAKKKAKKKKGTPIAEAAPKSSIMTRMKAAQMKSQQLKKQKVGVVYDEEMLLHRNHADDLHPERPERVMAIYLNLVKKK